MMLILTLTYAIGALAAVVALSVMILRIGSLMEVCPHNGKAVHISTITVTTGFAAIGTGGVILIGALVPSMPNAPAFGLFLALGLAALCLGLGFTQAVATLRAILNDPALSGPPFET